MKSEKEWINNLTYRMETIPSLFLKPLGQVVQGAGRAENSKGDSDMETVAGSSGSAGLAGVFPDVLVFGLLQKRTSVIRNWRWR